MPRSLPVAGHLHPWQGGRPVRKPVFRRAERWWQAFELRVGRHTGGGARGSDQRDGDFSLVWNCDLADVETESGIVQEKMPVTISDEVLKAAHITEPELKQELALALFQQERLTLAQASRLAGLGQLAFQALMAERRIPIHYGVAEFREDLQALRLTDRL